MIPLKSDRFSEHDAILESEQSEQINFSSKPPISAISDEERRRLSSVDLHDYPTEREDNLIKNFLCCYSIEFGVQFMLIFDVFATILWMALMFTFTSEWYLFVTYWCLSISRLVTGYWNMEKDDFSSRQYYYIAHVVSDICYGILFTTQFFI